MSQHKITHVIFDMDGLLLDTEKFYTIVSQNIASRYGKTFDWTIKSKVMGKKAIEAATIFVTDLQIPMTPEEHLIEREAALTELFPTSQLMPGVDRLVKHLQAHQINMGVATSSQSRLFALKTSQHQELFTLFNPIVKGDDPEVKEGKPSPQIFQIAASRFSTPPKAPENVLVFEDAPNGVEAAKAAGMHVVMVPDPNLQKEQTLLADQVIYSVLDFDPAYWGLPPF